MKTLLIGEIHPQAESLLRKKTVLTKIDSETFTKQSSFPGIEAVVLRTFTKLGPTELEKLPDLKYVVSCSVGIDNLDQNELKKRNIKLIHCEGTNANSVAEHTVYLMLSLLRNHQPMKELKGKTVGLVGFGNIGKLVARKLLGFEAKILAFDIIPQDQNLLQELNVEMVTLEKIFQEAELLTVHVPLNKHTEKMINEKLFSSIKPGTFFVNTSRAEVIDEAALLQHQHTFAGMGLDVYSERIKTELKIKNLILTNHTAAQGEDSFQRMCLEPIEKFLREQTL